MSMVERGRMMIRTIAERRRALIVTNLSLFMRLLWKGVAGMTFIDFARVVVTRGDGCRLLR
jgi:hypothetical protein